MLGYDLSMGTLFKKSVAARALPPDWRKEGGFNPDETVTVWVESEDPELAAAASLESVMDLIGERARARGLTDDALNSILNDG